MKYRLAGMVLLAAACLGCQRPSPNPQVAARVNGRDILKSEIDKYFNFRTREADPKPSGDEARLLRLEILRQLIEGEVMAQKAEELKMLPTDAEVDAKINEIKAGAAEGEYEKSLQERGIDEQDLRREIQRNLTTEKLIAGLVTSKVQVSDADVEAFYKAHQSSFDLQEAQYRLGQIIVTANPDVPVANLRNDKARNPEQAVRKVQLLASKLEGGEDFQQLAREYSEDPRSAPAGGDLGYHPVSALDQLGPQLKDAILKLNVGEMTPVVRTGDGFMILKVLGKREAGLKTLADPEIREEIRQELTSRRQQLLQTLFSEQLRDEYRVENFLVREIQAEIVASP